MAEFNDNQFFLYPPFKHSPIWSPDADHAIPVISPVGMGPKGEKGDIAYFKDLTDDEKAEIYKSMSFVGNEIVDAVYTTTNPSTATINIPIPNYDEYDLLWVFVEGLFLLENIDYSIYNGQIVLASPIVHSGTKVLFRALRFSTPDGDKELNVNQSTTEYVTNNYNASAVTGHGIPSAYGVYVGQIYIDLDTDDVYIAKTTEGDWIKISPDTI